MRVSNKRVIHLHSIECFCFSRVRMRYACTCKPWSNDRFNTTWTESILSLYARTSGIEVCSDLPVSVASKTSRYSEGSLYPGLFNRSLPVFKTIKHHWAPVLLFQPNYWLGHPESYLFSLSDIIFSGSKYPQNIYIYFWKQKHYWARTDLERRCKSESSMTVIWQMSSFKASWSGVRTTRAHNQKHERSHSSRLTLLHDNTFHPGHRKHRKALKRRQAVCVAGIRSSFLNGQGSATSQR